MSKLNTLAKHFHTYNLVRKEELIPCLYSQRQTFAKREGWVNAKSDYQSFKLLMLMLLSWCCWQCARQRGESNPPSRHQTLLEANWWDILCYQSSGHEPIVTGHQACISKMLSPTLFFLVRRQVLHVTQRCVPSTGPGSEDSNRGNRTPFTPPDVALCVLCVCAPHLPRLSKGVCRQRVTGGTVRMDGWMDGACTTIINHKASIHHRSGSVVPCMCSCACLFFVCYYCDDATTAHPFESTRHLSNTH